MRYALILILACVLAACGGTAPTATLPPTPLPTFTPTAEATEPVLVVTAFPSPTLEPTEAAAEGTLNAVIVATLPLPGTLVSAPQHDDVLFDRLIFTRTGGIAGETVYIELAQDGTLRRNDETTSVSAEEVARVDRLLDDIGFFALQGTFTSPSVSPDAYEYTLQVDRPDASATIYAQDGYMPEELMELLVEITELGS